MSDQLILGLVTAFFGTAGTVFASWMAFKIAGLATKKQVDETRKIAVATHEKVNSMSVILARKLADATEKLAVADDTPENREGAEDAAKALEQSEAVQRGIDPGVGGA